MANATSTFLQGANAANAAAGSSVQPISPATVDAAQVLAAISKPQISNVEELALELNVPPGSVSPILATLANEGLVEMQDNQFQLSDSGERALRYTEISKA